MQLHNWEQVEKEQLNPLYARQVIHADNVTVARIYMKKGCEVAEHSHHNEQVSMIEKGALKFKMGATEKLAKPGEVVRIEPNVLHSAEAMEDSVMVEVFSPRRQDWIDAQQAASRK